MRIAEASVRGRGPRERRRPFFAFAASFLGAAVSLMSPKCPRCGAREPAASTSPAPDQRATCFDVECQRCGHEWTIVAADPLLGL